MKMRILCIVFIILLQYEYSIANEYYSIDVLSTTGFGKNFYNSNNQKNVKIQDNVAYVINEDSDSQGIIIMNIENVKNPVQLGFVSPTGTLFTNCIALSSEKILVIGATGEPISNFPYGINIFNVTDSISPNYMKGISLSCDRYGGKITEMDISNRTIVVYSEEQSPCNSLWCSVTSGDLGVISIDISDIQNPNCTGYKPIKGENILINDNLVYVGTTSGIIYCLDKITLEEKSRIGVSGGIMNFVKKGKMLFVVTLNNGIFILDISNPVQLNIISHLRGDVSRNGAVFFEKIGIAASTETISIFDFSDPKDINIIDNITDSFHLKSVVDKSKKTVISVSSSTMKIFQLNDYNIKHPSSHSHTNTNINKKVKYWIIGLISGCIITLLLGIVVGIIISKKCFSKLSSTSINESSVPYSQIHT